MHSVNSINFKMPLVKILYVQWNIAFVQWRHSISIAWCPVRLKTAHDALVS